MGMFPPDDSSAVPVKPAPKPVGTAGYFTDGSLVTPATIVDCDFLNGVVDEFNDLATAGGVPLSKTTPTMVPNIENLITSGLAGYVRKVGDTMTGNLTLGQNFGGNSATPSLVLQSGATQLNYVMNAPVGAINPMTQAGDTLIWYTDGSINTGSLVLAPYGSGATGGLRMDSSGSVTFNRPLTLTAAATGLTPAVDNNSTNLATTAYVVGQAAITNPTMNSVAAAGSSIKFSRADHVHPTDTSRAPTLTKTNVCAAIGYVPVHQGGGAGQGSNEIYLGWDGDHPRIQVDSVDAGKLGTISGNNTWTGANTFNQSVVVNGNLSTVYGSIYATYDINARHANFSGAASVAGAITSQTNRVRALLGASNSGDPYACTNLNDFALSPGSNGYQVLPSGMILQWGTGSIYNGFAQIWFPIAFPHASLNIVASEGAAGGWGSNWATIMGSSMINNTYFYLYERNVTAGGSVAPGIVITYNWLAVGW